MNEFGTGRLPSDDPRDQNYPVRLALAAVPVPPKRKRPYRLGPTQNQARTPYCTGYSAWHKLAAAPIMAKPADLLSPAAFYFGAQDHDEWPGRDYTGSSVRGANAFLVGAGYIKSYVWASTTRECIDFLLGGYGTMLWGTNWYPSMFVHDYTGRIMEPEPGATPDSGHAFHVFWYHAPDDEFWFQNSWLPWGVTLNGQPGCGKIPRRIADRLLHEDGEACAGIERKVIPLTIVPNVPRG
jgi:hypothetical protein